MHPCRSNLQAHSYQDRCPLKQLILESGESIHLNPELSTTFRWWRLQFSTRSLHDLKRVFLPSAEFDEKIRVSSTGFRRRKGLGTFKNFNQYLFKTQTLPFFPKKERVTRKCFNNNFEKCVFRSFSLKGLEFQNRQGLFKGFQYWILLKQLRVSSTGYFGETLINQIACTHSDTVIAFSKV